MYSKNHQRISTVGLILSLTLMPAAVACEGEKDSGMVVSAHPMATQAGIDMLRAGGNAIDAAVAVAFTLAVVEPYSSGLGGGGFALIRFKQKYHFLNFREVAPKRASRDMFVEEGKPQTSRSKNGPLAVAVPGAVHGYLSLLDSYGNLPRTKVLQPSYLAARDGFPVDKRYVQAVEKRLAVLQRDSAMSRVFLLPSLSDSNHQIPPLGHIIKQPDLARTISEIQREGLSLFYHGKIAEQLVKDMQQRGGLISADDLINYRSRSHEPLIGSFRNFKIVTAPLPSAGGLVILTVLNILEHLETDLNWHHVNTLHTYIEAAKRAYADRALLGDPAFVPNLTGALLAKDRGEVLARLIREENQATPSKDVPPGQGAQLPFTPPPSAPIPESPGTSHLCVIDAEGNALSMTTTINSKFGAGIMAFGTGIVWNNEMDDFAIAPGVPNSYGIVGSEANAVEPGKTPLSSMSPTFVLDGSTKTESLRLIAGSPGGARIPTTVLQIILNHLVFKANLQQTMAMGRIHHQHLPESVWIEPYTLDPLTKKTLEELGHSFSLRSPWSNATAISIDSKTNSLFGAADPRGIGIALGE